MLFDFRKSALCKAINQGLKTGDLGEELNQIREVEVSTVEEAQSICLALQAVLQGRVAPRAKAVHGLTNLFQSLAEGGKAGPYLKEHGIPLLLEVFAQMHASGVEEELDVLLFMLKILAGYKNAQGAQKIIELAQAGFQADNFFWSTVFCLLDGDHPHAAQVYTALADPLPDDFLAVALLDGANNARRTGGQFRHPFDGPAGHEKLGKFLADPDPDNSSYAMSATTALPYISEPPQRQYLEMALNHTEVDVRLEAAWAAAVLGYELGFQLLVDYAGQVNTSEEACGYLAELKREDLIPEQVNDPDFKAMAEMANWLAHPQEFGRAPDRLELYDSRELYWPPTEDRRWLWLFEYHYITSEAERQAWEDSKAAMSPEDQEGLTAPPAEQAGLGMVGSTTFALIGETTVGLSPMDAYALHCCWELQQNDDPRAPEERSVTAGRKLLAEFNRLED